MGAQLKQSPMLHRLPVQGWIRRHLTLRLRQLIEWILQREAHMRVRLSWLGTLALFATWISVAVAQTDPLPSWNDGPAKQAIVAFVTDVTREGSPDFVPTSERVATFDNDGTLWIEQPIYVQFAYALERVRALAPQHPEWKDTQPFKAVLEGDMAALGAAGEKGAVAIIAATHAGMTPEEFRQGVKEWLATARHPRFGRRYDEL